MTRTDRRRFPILLASALALLAILGALFLPDRAQAQAAITLVSNIGQTSLTTELNALVEDFALQFTTGENSGGYNLDSIELKVKDYENVTVTVSLYSDSSDDPESSIFTFTNPTSGITANANNTFTAPADTTLMASTPYHIVVSGATDPDESTNTFGVSRTNEDAQDAGGATNTEGDADWDIADGGHWRSSGNWGSITQIMQIRVNGSAVSGDPPPSCTLNTGDLWCGVMTVGEFSLGPTEGKGRGYRFGQTGSLTDDEFPFDGDTPYRVQAVYYVSEASSSSLPAGTLALTIDLGIPDGLTLQLGNEQFPISNASSQDGTSVFWSGSGLSWSVGDQVTLRLSGEAPPTVTVADATATEGDAVEFVVTLSAVSGRDVMVAYATSETDPQSAVSGTDFTSTSGTLTIAAADNTATGTIQVPTTEDDASESAETFTLTLSNPTNATLGTPSAATGTINDNDGTTLSTDATLSALSLGTGVTLSPAFASGTTTYTASVANSVDEVTVTPTTNHASATVEILDTDALALTDADSTEDGFQVALSVGSTQLGVLVMAEDGTTTKFYTVNVTRDDFPNDNTTTGKVEVGGTITGNIGTVGDYDRFKVELEAGTRYQLDLEGADTGRGTLADPHLGLYDNIESYLQGDNGQQGDDNSGVGVNARMIYTPDASGDFYPVVTEVNDNLTGTYTLSVIVLGANSASEADTDFPNTTATTGRVDVGASATGNIENTNDEDWFRVDLEAGKTYQFDLEGVYTSRGTLDDPYLALFDGSGTYLFDDDDGGTSSNSRITRTPATGGTYYLRAARAGTSGGTYTLSVRDITPCTLDTGDIWCGVVTVGEFEQSGNTLAYGFVDATTDTGALSDTTFDVSPNSYTIDRASVGVSGLAGHLIFSLTSALTEPDRAKLVLHVDGSSGSFAFDGVTPTASFGYRWTMSGLDWSSETSVTLRLRETPVPSTDATLSGLSLGTGVTLSPAFASGTTTYTASVTNSVDEVTVTPPTNHASATVEILDADDNDLDDADDVEDDFQVALSVGDTVIKVKVTAEDTTTTQTYTVIVTRDDFPHDTTTTGQVDVGGSVTGNIESVGDGDWFLVELEAGTRYQIDLEGADTGRGTLSDPDAIFYDASTVILVADNDSGVGNNARMISTPTESGTHYVQAAGPASGDVTGTYTLSVIVLGANGASEADTDFPHDTATTGRVEVGASVTGNMYWGSDFDWFRVDLEAGKTYQFDLEGSPTGRGSLGDPFLQIFDASGSNKLAEDNNGGTGANAQIVYTATATGAHYLTAQNLTNSTGTYTLSVRDITMPPPCTLNTGEVWCGVMTVGQLKTSADALVGHGFADSAGLSAGSLAGNPDDTMFSVGDNDYTISSAYIQVPTGANPTGTLYVLLSADLTDDDEASLVLTVDDTTLTFAFSDATTGVSTGLYSWGMSGLDWSSATTVTLRLRDAPADNNAPVFSPTSATREVAENSVAGTNVGAVIPAATDADTGDTLTYSMAGTDAASFAFDASTRQITTITGVTYNYEAAQNSYSVTVKASDGTDSGELAVTINLTDDATEKSDKPDKPTLAQVAGSSTSLTATWTKPDLDGGPDITGYDVQYREGTGGAWMDFTHTGTAVTTTITGLTANTEYQLRVRAKNGEGDSDWSDPSDAVSTNAANTALSGIEVNGTSIPGFLADDDAPQYGVSAATTAAAIVATAEAASATVSYSGTDADTSTADAHDVNLADGANSVTITVTDGGESDTYTLGVNRAVTADYGWKADSDFDTLKLAGNVDPRGIWSDGAVTVYVSDYGAEEVYAYNMDGTRDSSKDITVGQYPNGIWSDGVTLWVADSGSDKLLAYTLASGARDADEDFDTLDDADNETPRGVFSDGTTMWVADSDEDKIYAYKMSDKSRDADEDFDTLDAAGNNAPRDIWSDGTTMWVADSDDGKIYAYKMSDKSRDADKDFDTLDAAGNDSPRALWSHGSVLWASDDDDDKLYAYNLPAAAAAPTISTVAVTSTPVLDTDTYGAGETIEVSVTFDEAVNATSDTDFELNVSGDRSAPLLRGSGTATLVFGYTVVSSDDDDNGIWIGDQDRTLVGARRLMAQSGTITSVATSIAADLTHAALGTDSDHKVDGSRSIVSVAVSSTPMLETDTYGAGETIRFTVTFSAAVNIGGSPVFRFSLGNLGVGRQVDAAYESGAGSAALVFGYTVVSSDEDDDGIWIGHQGQTLVGTHQTGTITIVATSEAAGIEHAALGVQTGHKVDGSRTAGNNAPSFTSSATFDAAENQTTAGTVVAADSDSDDDVTGYAITGGADQAFFSIGGTSGVLTFDAAPNFEDPQDSGTDNTYVVEVTATSGTGTREMTADQTITVTVTDVDTEAPGKPGGADGVGGVGDQPEGELVGAVQRGSAHYGLRRAAPDILAGGLVDGEERPVHRGGDREPIGEHLLRRAGAGNQRRGHRRVVGLGQRHDGRGGAPADAEHRRCRGRRGRRRGVHGDADGGGLGEGDGDLDGVDRERRHGGGGGSRDDEDGGRGVRCGRHGGDLHGAGERRHHRRG